MVVLRPRILLNTPAQGKLKRRRSDTISYHRRMLPLLLKVTCMRHPRLKRACVAGPLLAVALLAGLTACDSSQRAAAFFPLEHGRAWHYRISLQTMDGERQLRHSLANRRGASEQPTSVIRTSTSGREHQYIEDAGAIYRLHPEPDAPGRHLVLPASPAKGMTWQAPTLTAALENSGPPWETLFRIVVPVDMTYTVSSTTASVATAAGRFDNCLLIVGEGRTNADVGNYIGRTDIAVNSREWFAPGVGLVKMERYETTGASAISEGRLTMELAAWHIP